MSALPVDSGRSDAFPYGTLGQLVETRDCIRDDPGKMDCLTLEKCKLERDQIILFGDHLLVVISKIY